MEIENECSPRGPALVTLLATKSYFSLILILLYRVEDKSGIIRTNFWNIKKASRKHSLANEQTFKPKIAN